MKQQITRPSKIMLLTNEFSMAMVHKRYYIAIGIIEELIRRYQDGKHSRSTFLIQHYRIEKVKLLAKINEIDKAIILLKKVKKYNKFGSDSYLFKIEAEIYYDALISADDFGKKISLSKSALDSIEKARELSEKEKMQYIIDSQDNVKEQIIANHDKATRDIIDKELDLKMIITSLESEERIKKFTKKFRRERIRQFEQLGLFAAVISLVVTNAGSIFGSGENVSLGKIFYYNIAFIMSLALLLGLGSIYLELGNEKGDIKKIAIIVLVGLFLFGIVLIKPF